ncbi:glucose transporter/sensor [Scheffersomyces xylosifermentans]|uniref:glucose transporter/sensor n=1 Tax=Scheffersomyces xylosifermentans TaxID=1304137 RepID=UPI00315CE7AF
MGLEDSKLLQKYINFGEKKAGSTSMGIFVGLFAAFGGILFGYDTGTISGILAMDYVTARFPKNNESFTSSETSLIVSILSVGTFFGSLSASFFSDKLGRRWTLIIATLVIFNLGIILQTAATSIPLLCVGRVFAGLGVGLISAVIPLYQAETVPKWIRGAVVSCYQWAITLGILLANVVNQGTHARNDSGSYRIPIAVQFLWAIILGGGMLILPETPRFWVSKGDEARAKDSLSRLRKLPIDNPDLIDEYDEIKANFDFENQYGSGSWGQVFANKNHQRKRLLMGVGIQALQQLTGINFIFYFGTTFFKRAGIKNEFVIQMATSIVNFGSTVPGILLIEVLGRRKLLLGGSCIMAVSQLIVAIVGVATGQGSTSANQCLVAFVCIFIAAFAATWGPLCWAVIAECYPLSVRQKSISLCTASNWLWNWGIAYATPYMVNSGPGNANLGSKVFFIWGGCNVIGGLFVWALVYETKGLTLEQVDELYEKVPQAWHSSKFIPAENAFRQPSRAESLASSSKAEGVSEVEEASV